MYLKDFCFIFFYLLHFSLLIGQSTKEMGINLSHVSDYSTELVFTNAFLQCRPWISSNSDNSGPWDTGIDVPLRYDGYPLEIPYDNGINPPQKVKTLIIWDLFDSTPKGTFRLKSSGTGQIRLSNGASGIFNSPCDVLVEVNDGVILEILSSNINDPIHDIKFILPDYINNFNTKIFTDELLFFLKDFSVIRFMDFTNTNGSQIVNWSERTKRNYYSQAISSGVSWEYVTDLANLTKKNIWINIPHKANNTFIDSLANFLNSSLDSDLKVYLEFSNEVWNSAFSQHLESAELGDYYGFTGQPWEKAWKVTAKRSADIFKIFEDIFFNDNRIVKIIPSQAANSWLSNHLITLFNDSTYNPYKISADALAIAPYFGNEIADNLVSNGHVNSILIDEILDSLNASLNKSQQWISENLIVANSHNLELITYEGGQHLVATGNNINNNVLTQKLITTNKSARIKDIYCDYLDFWFQNSGNLFCHFNSTSKYSRYGSWGLREDFQDSLNPKYLALKNCVFKIPSLILSTISADSYQLMADSNAQTVVTVTLMDSNNQIISRGGEIIEIFATAGSISVVTDNNNGTYTAILKGSSVPTTSILTFEINGLPANQSIEIDFIADCSLISEDINLLGVSLSSPLYIARNTISTSGFINNGNQVNLISGHSIHLKPGFTVFSGGIFSAKIISCFNFKDSAPKQINRIQFLENNLKIYPNPSSGYITLEFEVEKSSTASIIIYDILGKEINRLNVKMPSIQEEFSENFNLFYLEDGIYIIKVLTNNWTESKMIFLNKN